MAWNAVVPVHPADKTLPFGVIFSSLRSNVWLYQSNSFQHSHLNQSLNETSMCSPVTVLSCKYSKVVCHFSILFERLPFNNFTYISRKYSSIALLWKRWQVRQKVSPPWCREHLQLKFLWWRIWKIVWGSAHWEWWDLLAKIAQWHPLTKTLYHDCAELLKGEDTKRREVMGKRWLQRRYFIINRGGGLLAILQFFLKHHINLGWVNGF